MSNPYEDANRTKKVAALVAEIDGLSRQKLGRVLSGPDGAAFLRTFTDANWAALARRARLKKPPSPITQDLVIRAIGERGGIDERTHRDRGRRDRTVMENLTHQLELDRLFTAVVAVEGDAAYLHSCSEHLAGLAKEVEARLIRRAICRLNQPARAPRKTLIGVAPPPPTHQRFPAPRGESRTRYSLTTGDLVQT